jgi:hypothetical protein
VNRSVFASVVLLAGSIACASAPTTDRSMNLQVITQQEIERTGENRTTPNVYVNGQYLCPTESLASVAVSAIAEIRLYHAGEVPPQWEQNNPSGLISIKTK